MADTAFVVSLGGLGVAVWQSGVAAGVATRLFVDLAVRGFAGELVLAGTGIVALSFLAGAKGRGLAVATIGLLLIANASMFGPSNASGHYPTSAGGDEVSLVTLVMHSPQGSVPDRTLISLKVGQLLGSSSLSLPTDDELAAEVDLVLRAFTDVDTEFRDGPSSVSSTILRSTGIQSVGSLNGFEVFVLGSSDHYFWIPVTENSIVIVSEGLVP